MNRVIFLGAKKNDRKNYFLPINRVTIYSDKLTETSENYYNINAVFRKMNFEKMSKTDIEEGSWFLTGEKESINKALAEIVQLLNGRSDKIITISKLRSTDADYREDSLNERLKPEVNFSTITEYSILIISCLAVILCIFLETDIFIYLTNGYSIADIAKKIVVKKVLSIFIFLNLVFFCLSVFVKTIHFTREYFIESLMLLLGLGICTFIMIQIIQFRKLNGNSLKMKKEKRLSFVCVYILKVYLLFSLFPALSTFSTLIVETTKYFFQSSNTQSSNIGLFYPYYIGNNEQDSGLGKIADILSANRSILETIPYEDRFLVDTVTYDGNDGWKRAVFIDTNYLKHHTIYDVNHKKIEVKSVDSRETLIIPKSIKTKEKRIKELFQKSTDSEPHVEIAENNISLPVYQIKRSTIEGDNFFICVVPENRLLTIFPNIIGGMGDQDGLKVLLKGKSAETYYRELLPCLEEKGISDNLPAMFEVREIKKAKLHVYEGNLIVYLSQNLYLLGILFLLLYYSIFLFIKINQREYFVKRVNGYTTCSTYRSYYLIFIIENILVLVWSFLVSNSSENYIGTAVFILLCNIVMSWLSLRMIERNQKNGG